MLLPLLTLERCCSTRCRETGSGPTSNRHGLPVVGMTHWNSPWRRAWLR
jgi:hypothetical protein